MRAMQRSALASSPVPNYHQTSEQELQDRDFGRRSESGRLPEGSAFVLGIHCQRTASAPRSGVARARAMMAGLVGLMLLGGCTSSSSQTASIFSGGLLGPPAETQESAPAAVPASAPPPRQAERGGCENAAQCKSMLKTMIDSPDRGWIGQQQSPDAYANGTRLFAYRALRKQLTCGELTSAVNELSAATRSLGGPVSGMSSDQLSRTKALCSQVEGELAKEREGRCRT
jgi:hypothetical protein